MSQVFAEIDAAGPVLGAGVGGRFDRSDPEACACKSDSCRHPRGSGTDHYHVVLGSNHPSSSITLIVERGINSCPGLFQRRGWPRSAAMLDRHRRVPPPPIVSAIRRTARSERHGPGTAGSAWG